MQSRPVFLYKWLHLPDSFQGYKACQWRRETSGLQGDQLSSQDCKILSQPNGIKWQVLSFSYSPCVKEDINICPTLKSHQYSSLSFTEYLSWYWWDRSGKVMEKATHHGWEQPVLTAVFMVPQCPTFAVGEEGSKPLYHWGVRIYKMLISFQSGQYLLSTEDLCVCLQMDSHHVRIMHSSIRFMNEEFVNHLQKEGISIHGGSLLLIIH